MKEWTRSSEYLVARIIVVVNFKSEETNEYLFGGDKHGICPPMKSSLFRVFMTRHLPGYAPEASVLRFPSSWQGRNH
jgi:hypothetical protein